jgi:uncharacterized protein (TIGR02266 family)
VTATATEALRQYTPSSGGKARRKARAYRRVAVRCGCWLEHDFATIFGTTVDLGRGGLFLRTALPMPPGMPVRVTLRLPGSETVVADGKVVRTVASAEGDRPGLGVRFERMPQGEDSLSAFLFGNLESDAELAELSADTAT